jgi:dTDP-4-amino-4,6-dideoxygalactose transaminase
VIPLVDLQAAHSEVAEEVDTGFKRVIAETAFIGGEEVSAFEREYASFSGVAYCVGVANGTDALELALRATGVSAGDAVILPANTFVATAEAVARVGGRCVLVDIDPQTYLLDIDATHAAVSGATRAVVPVHLYGQLAPVERLVEGLNDAGVAIVEDAAQCQGATRHGHSAGSGGLAGPTAIASTSFYPGKNLGAYGDAGAVVTEDAALATTVRTLGSHGGLKKYLHEIIGVNSRLDGLQAVVLRAKLNRLAAWNAARRAAATRYHELLEGLDVIRPVTLDGNEHVWHLYVVRIPGDGTSAQRDAVLAELAANGIGAGIHYPVPIHLTPAFSSLGYGPGAFPRAERAAHEILSLPLFPQITLAQQEKVIDVLANALS